MRPAREQSTAGRDRMAAARHEIGQTDVAPWTAWTLTIGFLVAIFAVPVTQLTASLPDRLVRLNAPALVEPLLAAPWSGDHRGDEPRSALARIGEINEGWRTTLQRIENIVGERSQVAARLRPWTQYVLTRWLGAGNEQVYPGRDGWLFYRRSVDFLSGPAFPAPEAPRTSLARYAERERPRQRDPLPAILDFKRQLDRRGVTLVLVPVPPKPSVHPEKLIPRGASPAAPLTNPAYPRFVERLRQAGVLVFDPAPLLVQAHRQTGRPQYLATDTHWRPEAVIRVTAALADFLEQHVSLPPRPSPGYRTRLVEHRARGDLVRLLDVPLTAAAYGAERVMLREVRTVRDALWQPDPEADVLVLGDSFTNIFALPTLGWGAGAGFAEQLAFALQRPVDRIALNDNGAFAPRVALQQELARGDDRLAGKRVVVWQFVAHELAFGDWRVVDLGLTPSASGHFAVPRPGLQVLVTAVVRQVAPVPRPRTVPYRDHIVAVHLTELAGLSAPIAGTEALVFVWSLREDEPQLGSRLRPGDRLTLRLRPWSEVAAELEGINRSELPDLLGVSPWWGEPAEPPR